jgi:hypothetical protein
MRLVHFLRPQSKERLLKQIRKRLTYANVMSSLAVFLILGGATAFAAVKKIGANEIKANSIKTGKIVKEAVTAGKIKQNAIDSTKVADGSLLSQDFKPGQLPSGREGKPGPAGPVGPAGSAVAYAKVEADGTVDAAQSKNVTTANVEQITPGAYCFHNLSFTPHNAIATLLNFQVGEITAGIAPDIGSVCAPGVQARVETYNSSGTAADAGFLILFN